MNQSHWDVRAAYEQLVKLADQERKSETPRFDPWAVVAIVLDELSRTSPEVCNFTREVELVREGRYKEAYIALDANVGGIQEVSPLHVWVKSQARASISKLPVPGIDRESAAYQLWNNDEHRCKRTNQKLVAYRNRFLAGRKTLPWMREVQRMREFCAYVLGEQPDLDAVKAMSKYGPGASVGVRGDATHYANKVLSWDCTSGCVDLAVDALALDKGAWEVFGFDPRESTNPSAIDGFKREARKLVLDSVCNHDTLIFIFKNAKALRSITVQPTLSGMVQLGIDAVVKQLLLERANIDLTDQSLNRRLAFLGSRDWLTDPNPWCTIDKKSASNLIAKLLPGFVLPGAWSKLLWSTRSPLYQTPPAMGGDIRQYEMYAGMGNGTTFGVESLFFLAAAYAVSEVDEPSALRRDRFFSIFGDDLLIRQGHAAKYIEFIEYLGFRINHDKSFISGPFRESCGADYWNGINVRPAYVRGDGMLEPLELIGVHNTLMDSPFFCMLTACKRIRALWSKVSSWPIPSDPAGGLGFRTTSTAAWDYVEKAGKPVISPVWFRPRGFYLEIRPKQDVLKALTPYVALAVALQRGRQSDNDVDQVYSLPFRSAYNIRVVPEMDLRKKDLIMMLRNQLQRLALRKLTGWWIPSRGLK